MAANPAGDAAMAHSKMRRSAEEDAIAPGLHPIFAPSQTSERRGRSRERPGDRKPYKSSNDNPHSVWSSRPWSESAGGDLRRTPEE
jgi:hypothetical protein